MVINLSIVWEGKWHRWVTLFERSIKSSRFHLVQKLFLYYIWSYKFHFLNTLQQRLPSFLTLDERLALMSGYYFLSNFFVSLFSKQWFWCCWYQNLIKNGSKLILSVIPIPGLAPSLSYFSHPIIHALYLSQSIPMTLACSKAITSPVWLPGLETFPSQAACFLHQKHCPKIWNCFENLYFFTFHDFETQKVNE